MRRWIVFMAVIGILLALAACSGSTPAAPPAVTPVVEGQSEPAAVESPETAVPAETASSVEQPAEPPVSNPTSTVAPSDPSAPASTTEATSVATETPAEPAAPTLAPLTVPPIEAEGTVANTNRLNARSGPGTGNAIVGHLAQGDRVQITRRQSGWLQVVYPGSPDGLAWISADFVAVDGEAPPATPTPRPKPAQPQPGSIPAPVTLPYENFAFSWRWDAADLMQGQDWYFDLLFFQGSSDQQYDAKPAEVAQTSRQGDVWTFPLNYPARCNSYWIVRIAVRENGQFKGWVSDRSNRQTIGPPCVTEPTPTDCPDCGL